MMNEARHISSLVTRHAIKRSLTAEKVIELITPPWLLLGDLRRLNKVNS